MLLYNVQCIDTLRTDCRFQTAHTNFHITHVRVCIADHVPLQNVNAAQTRRDQIRSCTMLYAICDACIMYIIHLKNSHYVDDHINAEYTRLRNPTGARAQSGVQAILTHSRRQAPPPPPTPTPASSTALTAHQQRRMKFKFNGRDALACTLPPVSGRRCGVWWSSLARSFGCSRVPRVWCSVFLCMVCACEVCAVSVSACAAIKPPNTNVYGRHVVVKQTTRGCRFI